MRFRITISYDGTNFSGWQVQKRERTVQGEIERALAEIFKAGVKITGAGRTDAKAHALGQVAHFDIDRRMAPDDLKNALNAHLTREIRIIEVAPVDPKFHARFSARAKIYRYQISFEDSPFRRNYYWYIRYHLDKKRMEQARSCLMGRHDFTNLAGDLEGRSPVCELRRIDLTDIEAGIIIEIEGDRFLPQMVRRIVGLLVDVGRGRYDFSQVEMILSNQADFSYQIAPACGLYLVRVIY
ncbi:tRNA pseudouridine(38-40) synthase TruA [candidate division WOR-3 bacterium]|uniref:tRNA pseudouridine synthase A n=1 Tax=candidate division WOR-3 bacterium TaxID=2052148 RepID=A0A660SKH3_UNCW3|nr:MAG: tRNA pseudouridine(38-40) synthase TruA [candidate division WOR-3 bacterium]